MADGDPETFVTIPFDGQQYRIGCRAIPYPSLGTVRYVPLADLASFHWWNGASATRRIPGFAFDSGEDAIQYAKAFVILNVTAGEKGLIGHPGEWVMDPRTGHMGMVGELGQYSQKFAGNSVVFATPTDAVQRRDVMNVPKVHDAQGRLDPLLAIEHFEPQDGFWLPLDDLLEDLWEKRPPGPAADRIATLLRVFDRFPEDDGAGVLWSIVHGLEHVPGYEEQLRESHARRPTEMKEIMIERIGRSSQALN